MLTNRGKVKNVDFGLAQLAGQAGLGNAGMLMGTPVSMSPEQARGEEVDYRTDIWSLAVALYEIATGQLPFKGIAFFEQAIEKDPAYALAYAGLADCYTLRSIHDGLPPNESFPKAKAAASMALEIDDELAEAHASLAVVRFYYDWDWLEAEREFKHAIALNRGYATVLYWYAYYLIAMGRLEEAIAAIKRAHALEPLSLIINADVGDLFYLARRYDRALRKTLEMDSNFAVAHWLLGFAYGQKSMIANAVAACQKAHALSAGSVLTLGALGHAWALSEKSEEAQVIIDELTK